MEGQLAASRVLKYQHWPGASATIRGRIAQGGGVRVDFKGENFVFDPLPSRGGGSSKSSRDGGTKVETVGVK
jgi:hypothetical protein